MSEFSAKNVRRERRRRVDEIKRMGDGPNERVDASGYSPPGGVFSAMEKVAALKAKKPAYKRGGKVAEMHGEKHEHKGKKPRKRDAGGEVPPTRFTESAGPSWMDKAAGLKRGGKAEHADEAEDKKLIRKEVKKDALKREERMRGGQLAERTNVAQRPNALRRRMGGKAEEEKHGPHCGCPRCSGGAVERKRGGAVNDEHGGDNHWIEKAHVKPGALHKSLHVPQGDKIPEKKLEKAEHSKSKIVRERAQFAANVRKRGGSVSDGAEEGTRPDGGREARAKGGRTKKGAMNVNIVIATGKGSQPEMGGPPPGPPLPSPMLPPKPPMAPGAMGVPQGAPPGGQPPMTPPQAMMGAR